jgi:radical SAM superfamily enzyme YgiQ (UPF0313 family)
MRPGANFKLIVPPSPQIPTPGREFLLSSPIEGTSYIATVLKEAGYEVEIVDYRRGDRPLRELIEDEPVAVGVSTFIDAFCFLERLIQEIKGLNKDIPIILGGPFVSSCPRLLMEHLAADYAVLGEGELTILELVEAISTRDNRAISRLPGIAYKQNGEVCLNPPRPQLKDLDTLPLLDLFLWPRVKDNPRLEKLGLSSSRGCFSHCSFCFRTMRYVRQMSPERFCRQLEFLVERHGLRYAFINDLTFVIGRRRTLELCQGLKKIGIRWACSTRVDNIDEELLETMGDSGCEEVWYGFESVDQKVLDANFKDITVEEIERAVEITDKAGIRVMANFIIGLLGETQGSLNKMIEFIRTRNVIPCSIKYLTPFPGTYIYDYARQRGLIKDEIEYLRSLSRRKVNYSQDEIINCTSLPEDRLREAFRIIRQISYDRYGPLDWNVAQDG